MSKILFTFLVVVGLSIEVRAEGKSTGSVSSFAGSAMKSNMMGAMINMAVGVGLAGVSWKLCGGVDNAQANGNQALGSTGANYASFANTYMLAPYIPSYGAGCDPLTGRLYVALAASAFSTISYVQGAMDVVGVVQSMKTKDSATDKSLDGYSATNFDDFVMPDGTTPNQIESNLGKLSEAMKKNGMGLDLKNKKVTLPNGKMIDASMLGQGSGAIAAATGLPEGAVKEALDAMNKATKVAANDLSKYKLSFSGGGGGGPQDGGASKKDGLGIDFAGLFGKRGPNSLPKVSGLQKNIGGASVGVAQDDIFQMVQRRYQEKSKADFFSK